MALKSRPYAARALDLVLLLIIAWVLVGYIRYGMVAPPDFDGAMNLNTALSFVEGRGYGFFYSVFFPFPAQTDGPFTLPAGLLMLWWGVTPLTTQGVSLAYLVGIAVVGFLLLLRITRSSTFALGGTVLLLMTPGLFPFSMGGFGEIPTLFWLLLSLVILAAGLDTNSPSRLRLSLGGVALALCFLTKTVALLLVAPTLVLFVVMFVLRHRRNGLLVLWFLVGLALPILSWEVFRLVEIGSLRGYLEWWNLQVGQTLLQSGAAETLHTGPARIAKGAEHLRILGSLVETPPWVVAVFLLVPWFVIPVFLFHRWKQRDLGNTFCVAACGAISVLYFFWWLFVEPTQMAWLRRIVDGLIVQQILLVVALVALIRACRPNGKFTMPWRLLSAGLVVALIFSEAFLLLNGETLTNPPAVTAVERDTLALAKKVRDLPADATLFGFGWWKAPVLALFSGRPIMNFDYWEPAKIDALPHKYLILDFRSRTLTQDVQDILQAGTSHVVADGPGGAIYKLDKVLPYKAFTAADREPEKLRTRFAIAEGPYAATRAFYAAEGSAAWVKPEAALLLRRTDQTQLSVSIYVPAQLTAPEPGTPLQLHITSADCIDASVPIEPGLKMIVLPLSCPPSAEPEAMEISLRVNGRIPKARQIDAGTSRIAYLATDIHLQGP